MGGGGVDEWERAVNEEREQHAPHPPSHPPHTATVQPHRPNAPRLLECLVKHVVDLRLHRV
eukprot:1718325-Rhodomonas_salina.3